MRQSGGRQQAGAAGGRVALRAWGRVARLAWPWACLSAPGRTVFNLGARYRFKAAGADWLVRPVLLNAFDQYGWNVSPSGGFTYIPPRALTLQLVADF